MWVRSLGWEDPLGKGTATCYSVLAWRIPVTEEPGGSGPGGRTESDTTAHTHMHLCAQDGRERRAPHSKGQGEAQERPRPERGRGRQPEGLGTSWLLQFLLLVLRQDTQLPFS